MEIEKNEIGSKMQEKCTQTEQQKEENKDDCSTTLLDVLFRKVLQEIECPVCFEYMVPPITQCINGHNICGICVQNLVKCPTCRGDLTNVKNRSAEIISTSITHPCKYRKSGCTGQFLVDSKEEHERICRYGPHKCPFYIIRDGNCLWEGPMSQMKKHIKNSHENYLAHLIGGKHYTFLQHYVEWINEGYWYQPIFTMNNIFFSYSKIINNLHYTCYMFVGSREDTNRFKYTVTIKTPDGKQDATYHLECPNYLDIIDGNFPNENCATFNIKLTQLCVNKDEKLPMEYEITKY